MICEYATKIRITHFGYPPPLEVRTPGGRPIDFTTTQCHFGGYRLWFICPRCGRRCGILYPEVCRLCRGLRYASEGESEVDRLLRKALKIRTKLGQTSGGTLAYFPMKPKRMRWHTYMRLREEALACEARMWGIHRRQLGMD